MHRMLYIEEILLHIFGHLAPPTTEILPNERCSYTTHLVALARTCQTFKEPALDVLWEELDDFSLLYLCLPGVGVGFNHHGGYSFQRPLTEAEWNTLRGYTRRIWHIRKPGFSFPSVVGVVFTSAPFTPLFPSLRSIVWESSEAPLSAVMAHVAVPSLVSLQLKSSEPPSPPGVFDIIGERCPNIKQFQLYDYSSGLLDESISRQVCCWKNLQCVDCRQVTLSVDATLHLCSMPTLTQLSFILHPDFDNHLSHFDLPYVFFKLAILEIESRHLRSITSLVSHIRLPAIKNLSLHASECAPRRDVQAHWTAVQKACRSSGLTHLSLSSCVRGIEESIAFNGCLTLDDLLLYKDFGNLHKIQVDLAWSVRLTDADLLDLVSTSPRLEILAINLEMGWNIGDDGGGITLDGLVQLLRQRPYLNDVALVIDMWTVYEIDDQLNISLQEHESIVLDFLDSHISPELVPSLVSMFLRLDLDLDSMFIGGACVHRDLGQAQVARALWSDVMMKVEEAFCSMYG